MIGFMVGGPFGAAIGGGLLTPLGILVEVQLADKIKDPKLRAEFEEATRGRSLFESATNALGAGAAAYLANFLGTQTTNLAARQLGELASKMCGRAMTHISKPSVDAFVKRYANNRVVSTFVHTIALG
jgi:hypothetical protein